MKHRLLPVISAVLVFGIVACQTTNPVALKAVGSLELVFDAQSRSATALVRSNGIVTQAIRTTAQISFTAPTALGVTTDAGNNVQYISAKFNVNNLMPSISVHDLTLIAYQKSGNVGQTALKSITDFTGGALNQVAFAQAVQPVNPPLSIPFAVDNANSDLQFFTESELTALQTTADSANELSISGGEYLFPYGFVARASATSRGLPENTNAAGTINVSIRVPSSNSSSSDTAYRFSMTFIIFDAPVTTRVSESLEEQAASGAETRGNAGGFNTNQVAVVAGSSLLKTNDKLVNACRVRTAGTSLSPVAFLVATAPIVTSASFDQCFAAAGVRQFSLNAAQETLKGMALQSDEKIVLVGNTTSATTGSDFLVVRLNPDGSFDRSFGTNGRVTFDVLGNNTNDQATAVVLQADGKIVIGGSVGTLNNTAEDFAVIRVNTDGTRDTTFASTTANRFVADGGFSRSDQISGLALQTVGGVTYIIGAGTTNKTTADNDGALFRLKVSDGTLDTIFGTSGFTKFSFAGSAGTLISGTLSDNIRGVAVDANQKIVVVGEEPDATATNFRYGVIRFTSSGAWEMKAVTTLLGGAASGLILNSAGTQAVVCAYSRQTSAGTNDFLAMRFNLPTGATDGSLDTSGFGNTVPKNGKSFLAPSATNFDTVRACTTDNNGKIILVGEGRITAGGTSAKDTAVARLNADGTTDTGFDTDGILIIGQSTNADEAQIVKVTSSGKIIIAGFQRNPALTTDDDPFVLQINP
jgi:uncharacterized delta-60 repeat protein